MSFIVPATIISIILIFSLAAFSGMLIEKTGIINLSIEGFIILGALVYALLSNIPSLNHDLLYQWFLFPITGLIISILALVYSFIIIHLKANQTIASIALNTLALALSLFLIRFIIKGSEVKIQDDLWSIEQSVYSPLHLLNIVVFMTVPLLILIVVFLKYTKLGKKLQAVGENPHAAASLGIGVVRTRMIGMIIFGFISGMVGAIYCQTSYSTFKGDTNGIGYLAVAMVIFGQWKSWKIFLGAILFGTIYGALSKVDLIPFLSPFPYKEVLWVLPYSISLFVLIFISKKSKAPKNLGIPYYNKGR